MDELKNFKQKVDTYLQTIENTKIYRNQWKETLREENVHFNLPKELQQLTAPTNTQSPVDSTN